ncbi:MULTISPECIES: hypothetical protein [Sorangium]|uniref:Uncharacterized protein n=1 Tax=Sorangium cellulosum TaxID=56 RepID=A0A4V0NH04_SORCE|nr:MULTISPECIES: hypothetical protein [Sorangium]AUX34982.1 hypothetical protein SOCE836_071700 [Sorangium cellulosum]WCQ94288.1 hypothetical protein NQZ70_07052 [Sorangium sp. Soce836]
MWRKLQRGSGARHLGPLQHRPSARAAAPGEARSARRLLGGAREAARAALGIAAAALALAGCGGGEARAPNPLRALDERRAIEVIRRAMVREGAQPALGREVALVSGGKVRVDVGVQNRSYGVVYVTEEDAQALGAALPPPNGRDEKLRIVRGGPDGAVRIVLLYQQNYLYDDLVGESHERTTITAERELTRDVQDFITYARTQKFP